MMASQSTDTSPVPPPSSQLQLSSQSRSHATSLPTHDPGAVAPQLESGSAGPSNEDRHSNIPSTGQLLSKQSQPDHGSTNHRSGSGFIRLVTNDTVTRNKGKEDSGAVAVKEQDGYRNAPVRSVSLDDPDVRIAAEALGDLKADFSPPNPTSFLPAAYHSCTSRMNRTSGSSTQQPEPLLSLLTTSHPFLASTIGGAASAYHSSKNFSPTFKSGAEYVEGYLTPIANTVGSVGRVTGVEGGVRWFLGAGRHRHSAASESDAEDLTDGATNKRRRVDVAGTVDSVSASGRDNLAEFSVPAILARQDRRLSESSEESLPAYDEFKSPVYTESCPDGSGHPPGVPMNAAWQSRLIMSTSGLSIAMSEESLRSLRYCLKWLRWANHRIGGIIHLLRTTVTQYDQAQNATSDGGGSQDSKRVGPDVVAVAQSMPLTSLQSELATRVSSMNAEVLRILRNAVDTVSRYAGGALPENVRVFVRRQLTSLPQRFRLASRVAADSTPHPGAQRRPDVREGARRVLVLASEGLEMILQITAVLDGTIVTAEEWCVRLGKKVSSAKDDKRDVKENTAGHPESHSTSAIHQAKLVQEVLEAPEAPDVSKASKALGALKASKAPKVPNALEVSKALEVPEARKAPDVSKASKGPEAPDTGSD